MHRRASRLLTTNRLVSLLVLILCGGALAGGIALASSKRLEPLGSPGSEARPPSSPPDSVVADFSVLSQPAGRDDHLRVGTGPHADISPGVVRATGINPDLARSVSDGNHTFAVPANGSICTITAGSSVSCTPPEAVGRDFHARACGGVPEGMIDVSGLIADGATDLQVVMENGEVIRSESQDNYLHVRLPSNSPRAVEWMDEGQAVSVPIRGLPSEATDCPGG